MTRQRKTLEVPAVTSISRVFVLVAEAGFEPHDLRVMSPTSYQAAPLRDIKLVPEAGVEPVRVLPHGILSPGRLPIPPLRHDYLSATLEF